MSHRGPLSAGRGVKDGGRLPVQTLSEGVQLEQSRDRNAEDRRVHASYDLVDRRIDRDHPRSSWQARVIDRDKETK